jgi:hypothetical protein
MREIENFDVFAAVDDMLPTNKERAEKAYRAVFGFSYETPPDPEGYDKLS